MKALGNLRIYRYVLWRCKLQLHLVYILIFELLFDALDILNFIPCSGIFECYTFHYAVRGKKKKIKGKNLLLLFFSSCLVYIYEEIIFWDIEMYFHPAYRISSFMILRIYCSLIQSPLKPQHEKKHGISAVSVTALASLETKITNNKIHWNTSISFTK